MDKVKTTITQTIEPSKEFDDLIYNVFYEILIGIEIKLYKTFLEQKDNKDQNVNKDDKEQKNNKEQDNKERLQKLNSSDGMIVGTNILEYYLNQLYRTLVENNDESMVNKFKEIEKVIKLKPVTILNILSTNMMKLYPKFPREKLVVNKTENDYIDSVKTNLELVKKYFIHIVNQDLKELNESILKKANEKKERLDKKQGMDGKEHTDTKDGKVEDDLDDEDYDD